MSHIIGQEFEGNEPYEARVFSLIDNTHSTATKFLQHAVVGDGLPEK
jgi:hypothetical protein